MTQLHPTSGPSTASRPVRPDHPTLRLVTSADRMFLYELFVAVRGPAFAFLPAERIGPLFQQQYRAQQASFAAMYPDADHHVIELDGDAIGQIRVDRTGDSIVLVDVSLLPMCRNYGIGRHVIGGLVDEAEYTGYPVELSVAADNPARRLFDGLGFVDDDAGAGHVRMVRR